ncbi:MAG: hypothetical protein LCI00_30195 [Chloroflexi bacterium]|nr:hypothetical protein [Chloroflexota bacterium]MCC6892838.1 hypothetical protein [Anaerolineae bacterium]
MSLKILAYIRSHWFALLLIIVAILWWHIVDVFTSPNHWNSNLTNIDYWSLVTNPRWKPFTVYGFFGFAIIAGLLTYFYIVPNWKSIYRVILLVSVFLICTLSTCTTHSIRIEDSAINHIMSVSYQGDLYHLASYESAGFLSPGSFSYYVFQCDSAGNKCSKMFEELGGQPYRAKLVVSENKLIYEYDTTSRQLLPTTN